MARSETAMDRELGTLINHAEHKVDLDHVERFGSTRRTHRNLRVRQDEEEAKALAGLACNDVEPPELIGGDASVTSADPGIIRDTVRLVKDIDTEIMVLCGAGVKTGEDVSAALRLPKVCCSPVV